MAALVWLAAAEVVLLRPVSAAFAYTASSPYAGQINATVQASSPQIVLHWVPDVESSTVYRVYRKAPDDTGWGPAIWTATSPSPVNGRIEFADGSAALETRYEYRVTLMKASSVLPVPASGLIHPDGHTAPGDDHAGAWPADVYYGDMDGTWTTGSVNFINGNLSRVSNTTSDNKFDQRTVPDGPRGIPVELQVGRVDFHQINGQWARNAYPSEVELLRAYLSGIKTFPPRRTTRPSRRREITWCGRSNSKSRGVAPTIISDRGSPGQRRAARAIPLRQR